MIIKRFKAMFRFRISFAFYHLKSLLIICFKVLCASISNSGEEGNRGTQRTQFLVLTEECSRPLFSSPDSIWVFGLQSTSNTLPWLGFSIPLAQKKTKWVSLSMYVCEYEIF
jgi:hypothetical protein